MKLVFLHTIAGVLIGVSTGVAFYGTAVNGACVFGPIGFVFGVLRMFIQRTKNGDEELTGIKEDSADFKKQNSSADDALYEMARGFKKLCCIVWNLEMSILKSLGLISLFKKSGWWIVILFVILGAILLALTFPLGVIFTVSALAVADEVSQENDFKVQNF